MVSFPSKCKDWLRQFLPVFAAAILLQLSGGAMVCAGEHFPLYPCIQKNVYFWEAIYGHYTTRQGVLHDADDLGRIYTVVDLLDRKLPLATTINNERIQQEKGRIQNILQDLAAGNPPQTAEARRIAALFPQQQRTAFASALDSIRFQLGQKDRFLEGVLRSGRYLADFRKTLTSYGLPPELVYLPHVESSFNPKAYSKAGAAGLWQFTRSTGSDYLVINALIDERYDPYAATDAAARLLLDNYKALGSWPLALTAYNYGRAGMIRAVRDKGSYEQIFSTYDEGSFKFAARNFYSEFIAASRVAAKLSANPALRMEQPEPFTTFRLRAATPVPRLLAQIGLSREQFFRLNPALQKPVFEGKQPIPLGYLVRKPAPNRTGAVQITHNTSRHRSGIKAQPPRAAKSNDKIHYIVQKGDSITSIARKFQISPKSVLAANQQRNTVRTGEKILLPQ